MWSPTDAGRRATCQPVWPFGSVRAVLGEETPNLRMNVPTGRGDEASLVAAIAGGDRKALAALYDLHAPALLGIARRILGDRASAEDLLHDVFLEVWHHAAEYAPGRGSVFAWLTVRTRSRALDRLGRRTRHASAVERLGEEAPRAAPAAAAAEVDGARVRSLVVGLPPEVAAILELAYFEGLSCAEIALRLEIPSGTVKSRMARGLALLRVAIDRPAGGWR